MEKKLFKWVTFVLLACFAVLTAAGCTEKSSSNGAGGSDGDISGERVVLEARVTEINESSVTVMPLPHTAEYRSAGDAGIVVSLLLEDGCRAEGFTVGDCVSIVYDGMIAETYPAMILTVYSITNKSIAKA